MQHSLNHHPTCISIGFIERQFTLTIEGLLADADGRGWLGRDLHRKCARVRERFAFGHHSVDRPKSQRATSRQLSLRLLITAEI